MSDSEEETSMLLVSKEQVPLEQGFDYVTTLDYQIIWSSWIIMALNKNINESLNELTSAHDQSSTSHDDLLSSSSSAVQLTVETLKNCITQGVSH